MTSSLQLLDPGIIKNFKVTYKRKLMCYLLAHIADDQNAYEIANKIDIIQAIEWITSTWKEVSKDKNWKTALQNVTLWSNLLALMTKMSMNHVTISSKNYLRSCKFLPINSDEVDWRRHSVATCMQQQYGAANDIAIGVESNDGNDEDNENESDVSQNSPQGAVNLLDRLVYVDGMSVDDTTVLPAMREKIESLIIQDKRQTYIGDFFPKK